MQQDQNPPVKVNQLLLLLATVAFTAWAGVVVWIGQSITEQLNTIQQGVVHMDIELETFKLRQSERTTRLEGRTDALREMQGLPASEHDLP